MGQKLQGKIAVMTGGNSGIGFAAAKLFQTESARVAITGRRQQSVDDAVKKIGGHCVGFTSDTSNLAAISTLYGDIKKMFGRIDVLFLNAGTAKFGPFESVDEAIFDESGNVNFKGLSVVGYFELRSPIIL